MAEQKEVTRSLAKTFKRYIKVSQHLGYCLKFKTLEKKDIKQAYKRLRLAVQTKPTDGKVHTQVNAACSEWTEDTIEVIARHFEVVLADFKFSGDTKNWEEAWTMAVKWVSQELVQLDINAADRAKVMIQEKFEKLYRAKALFTRHEHFNDKFGNWKLSIQRPVLIIGDSNMSKLPKCNDERVQIDSYPGAKFSHALHMLKKTEKTDTVLKVILSFGINHADGYKLEQVKKDLENIFKVAQERFPKAVVVMPLISFSKHLPSHKKRVLSCINSWIEQYPHLSNIPEEMFKTSVNDHIHWSPQTAKHILSDWRTQFNF